MKSVLWAPYAVLVRLMRRFRRMRIRMRARAPRLSFNPQTFVSHPEPQSIGSFARGRQMVAGNFQIAGQVIEAPGRSIWEISDNPAVMDVLHTCSWIDDMAATDSDGRRLLQGWVTDWIRRYGRGSGPGWRPELTGQRLIRWISHALVILQAQDKSAATAFLRSVARQAQFLSKTWHMAEPGLPRIQALTGMIYAGLALEGMENTLRPAIARLGKECKRRIKADGSIDSRNPEELLEIFILLIWARKVLEGTDHKPDKRHLAAIERIAPTLRALRLGDGALVRFHSGGRGPEGLLDMALAESGVRANAGEEPRMGYMRMVAGRTNLVMDVASPPRGSASGNAHAGTLAIEMSSGRLPIICTCGPGKHFGALWTRASRATACHSTVTVEDTSSSLIWDSGFVGDTFGERLQNVPNIIKLDRAFARNGAWVLASHGGYAENFGVIHDRRLFLSPNGRELRGEDRVFAPQKSKLPARHKRVLTKLGKPGVEFMCRFHIHPDVEISLDLGGSAVSLKLKSEEIWVFRQNGGQISVEESVFLDQQRLKPRPSKQIVVRGVTKTGAGQITWALTRAQEGKRYTMDHGFDEELAPLV